MNCPDNIYYSKDHEWVIINDNIATVGITDYAQNELGDIIFIELPINGIKCSIGDTVGTIEAVKTVADLYSPLIGNILEVNSNLENSPELINSDPYKEGWILKINNIQKDFTHLLDSNSYKKLIS